MATRTDATTPRRDRRRTALTVAVVAVTLLGAGCGNSTKEPDATGPTTSRKTTQTSGGGEATRDEFVALDGVPGVTEKEIRFAVVGTKTGNPLGICILDCFEQGIKAYFDWRNSEGGIYGRQLVVGKTIDDQLGQNQASAQQVIADSSLFADFQATLVPSGWGDLNDAGVPTYTWGIHSTDAANRPAIFPSLAVRCSNCIRPAVPWIAKQVGATKAASIGYGVSENSKVCAQTFGDSLKAFSKESGVELVYTNDNVDYGMPNGAGPLVTAMKDAGVDFVAACVDLNGMKTLAQELKRQGMEDVVLYHTNSYDESYIKSSDGLFDGDVVVTQFRPFEADADGSALATFKEWIGKAGAEPSELAMVGWINASMAFDALLAAGPEFDRAAVIDSLNSMTDYTAGGLTTATDWTQAHTPYTRDNDQPSDNECQAMVRVKGSAFELFGDPKAPWSCWQPADPFEFDATSRNFG